MKHCLTIAGSDCSGGAGIQADLKTFSACGCFGMSVITSVVAENTCRVLSVYDMSANEVALQIDAVFEDIRVDGVKLGMLPSADIIRIVAEKLKAYKPPVLVCDPVLVATSGDTLCGGTVDAMREMLFPMVDLLTPNIPEAETISGIAIHSIDDFDKAAAVFLDMGVKAVLLKGGHADGDCVDVLYCRKFDAEIGYTRTALTAKRINSQSTHGTGCTLSSAITAVLAQGADLLTAVETAKQYISKAIETAFPVGHGHGPVNHFHDYYNRKGIR